MPKVYNMKDSNRPKDAVYVGRPTKWGNPYSHKTVKGTVKTASREDAIGAYRYSLKDFPGLVESAKLELKGKDLVCWCAPEACHADVLLEIANG